MNKNNNKQNNVDALLKEINRLNTKFETLRKLISLDIIESDSPSGKYLTNKSRTQKSDKSINYPQEP